MHRSVPFDALEQLTRLMSRAQSLAPAPPLFKMAVRGGLLRLTRDAVVIGEGWLGSRNVRCLPLSQIVAAVVEVGPLATGPVRLRLCINHGTPVIVEGGGLLAAARLVKLLDSLRCGGSHTSSTLLENRMAEAVVTIGHASGLHARPLAVFVRVAKGFTAEIQVENLTTGKGPLNGKSPLQLLMLAAQQGHQLRISAEGAECDAALAALVRLVEYDFAEHGHG